MTQTVLSNNFTDHRDVHSVNEILVHVLLKFNFINRSIIVDNRVNIRGLSEITTNIFIYL